MKDEKETIDEINAFVDARAQKAKEAIDNILLLYKTRFELQRALDNIDRALREYDKS